MPGVQRIQYFARAYLARPLLPLAVALPWMLAEIEGDLAIAGPAETRRLRSRAELIRRLLWPSGNKMQHPWSDPVTAQ
jgi:hypothetical protein